MTREQDFWATIAPRDLDDDTRTMLIADFSARGACMGLAEEMSAVLAEMLAGLRDAGAIDAAAAATVMLRWRAAFSDWRRGNGKRNPNVLMSIFLPGELGWCLPGLAPETSSRPTRMGRKRRPKAPPAG